MEPICNLYLGFFFGGSPIESIVFVALLLAGLALAVSRRAWLTLLLSAAFPPLLIAYLLWRLFAHLLWRLIATGPPPSQAGSPAVAGAGPGGRDADPGDGPSGHPAASTCPDDQS